MNASSEAIDLAATLRALRRRADLSQRELAERAGVPATTIARIESGVALDPRFRTVERLVAAAGGVVTAGSAGAGPAATVLEHPHEKLRDLAGRHFPAHLDVRQVVEAKDWWGAWWANWYNLPRDRWPREAPDHTFDLDRSRRDRRRRRDHGRMVVARLRIELLDGEEGGTARTAEAAGRARTAEAAGRACRRTSGAGRPGTGPAQSWAGWAVSCGRAATAASGS